MVSDSILVLKILTGTNMGGFFENENNKNHCKSKKQLT